MSDFINDRAGRSTKVTARTSYPQPAITTEDELVRCPACRLHVYPDEMGEEVCDPCAELHRLADVDLSAMRPWDVCTLCGAPTDRGECPKHERSRER